MPYGYTGKVLFVDLSTGKLEEQDVPEKVYKTVLSGLGLGAWYLYENMPGNCDPFSPDSIIGFVTGMLVGSGAWYTGRFMVVSKSPQSGGWNDSNCGGMFGPEMKRCGYDAIFIRGISERPVYLLIDNKGPRLKDASHVWGLDATEAEIILENENWVRKRPRVALIGTAGEKLSYMAGVMNDRGRAAGRGGHGAVMGSKKLKAIVCVGTKPIKTAAPDRIREINTAHAEQIRARNFPAEFDPIVFKMAGQASSAAEINGTQVVAPIDGLGSIPVIKQLGTCGAVGNSIMSGNCPTKNFGNPTPKGINEEQRVFFNGKGTLRDEKCRYHCNYCPMGCGGHVDLKNCRDGRFGISHRPEYETVASIGIANFCFNLDTVYYGNELLNRAGMDTISGGFTVGFAFELFEKGILTKEDCYGLELTWGNDDAVISLIQKICDRSPGLGDMLADGVKLGAERIGRGAEKYAVHAGGVEPGMHNPVKKPIMGLHFVADPTPARHMTADSAFFMMWHAWEFIDFMEKPEPYNKNEEFVPSVKIAKIAAWTFWVRMLVDCVGACMIGTYNGFENWRVFDYLNAATGWGVKPEDYLRAGEATMILRQLFQFKQGIDPTKVYVHKRLIGDYIEGPQAFHKVPVEGMRYREWEFLGWDPTTGMPTEDAIKKAGLYDILAKPAGGLPEVLVGG